MKVDYTGARLYSVMSSKGLQDDSITHFDLLVGRRGRFLRARWTFEKSPPNPVLRVDFSEVRKRTALRPLILTEDHISVDDPDTRDPSDTTKVDASRIKFRITNIDARYAARTCGHGHFDPVDGDSC